MPSTNELGYIQQSVYSPTLSRVTTNERVAMAPLEGAMVFDSTLQIPYVFSSNNWVAVSGSGGGIQSTEFVSGTFRIKDQTVPSKTVAFDVSNVATGTTRTITMPNTNVDLSSLATLQLNTTTIQSAVDTLQQSMTDVQENVTTIEAGISTIQSDISTLQNGMADAQENINTNLSLVTTAQTDIDGFPDALKSLTSTEINQLANIDTNTITNTNWSHHPTM